MNNNQNGKKTCITKIRLQFKRMGDVESYHQNIPGTSQRFDVVCSIEGRGLLKFFPPKAYIVFQIFEKIGNKQVKEFKGMVQDVITDKVEIKKAFMCLPTEKKAECLIPEVVKILAGHVDLPIDIFYC